MLFTACLFFGRAVAQITPDAPSQHKYWDRPNKILFITHVGVTTVDFIATHRNLSNGGRELNPVAKGLCESGTPGQVVFFGGRVISTLSVSYALHRIGRHKLERGVTLFMIGDSAYGATYSLAHH
jgi:hypothetical protein